MLAPESTPVRYVRCRHSTPNGLTTINNARSNRSVDEGIVSKHTLTACLPHQDLRAGIEQNIFREERSLGGRSIDADPRVEGQHSVAGC